MVDEKDGKIVTVEPFPDAQGKVPPSRLDQNQRGSRIERTDSSGDFDAALEDMPPPHPRRWGMRMKANVVAAVRQGYFSLGDVCDRYGLSAEEFASWQRALDQFGLAGLRQRRVRSARDRGAIRRNTSS